VSMCVSCCDVGLYWSINLCLCVCHVVMLASIGALTCVCVCHVVMLAFIGASTCVCVCVML